MDKTVCSRVWWHTQGSSGRPASDPGWGSSSKTATGSLSTGSQAGRTRPQGKVLRLPIRALPSVIVVSEKVMREADGPVGRVALTAHFGWKGDCRGVHLESWTGEPVRNPKITSGCARKPHRWLLEYRRMKRFVWFLDRCFTQFTPLQKKLPTRHMWSREGLSKGKRHPG